MAKNFLQDVKARYARIQISETEVSEDNVRKTGQYENLEELKNSIRKFGLLQPIVVEKENNVYKVIIGQRRFRACKELGWKEIDALIVNKLTHEEAKLISFGENIHRRPLNFEDTMTVCDYLFQKYKIGDKPEDKSNAIKKVAIDLGISPNTVSKYLAYQIMPKKLLTFVAEGKISKTKAYRITTAFWPNQEKIVKVADYVTQLTGPEWDRFLTISKDEKDLEKAVEKAKKSKLTKMEVIIDYKHFSELQKIAEKRDMDIPSIINEAIEKYISEDYSQKYLSG
jgi:ParB/RepB/Spo0J family partition protein